MRAIRTNSIEFCRNYTDIEVSKIAVPASPDKVSALKRGYPIAVYNIYLVSLVSLEEPEVCTLA